MTERKTPLEEALKFEEEGRTFFTTAAEKSGDPLTKEIYEYLAMMELKHMEDIKRISAELKEKGKFPEDATLSSTSDKISIFKEALKQVKKEKELAQEEVTALRNALALEFKGREMYEKFSHEAKDNNEKQFYELLADEEQKHFDIIYEYLEFFEDKGLRMQE
jgi:rubrerythrin